MVVHDRARLLKVPAKLVVTGFGQDLGQIDPKTGKPGLRLPPKIIHVDVDDFERIADAINRIAQLPHYNVYMSLAAFSPDLNEKSKGGEADVVYCFGIVADFDDADAPRWAERLPIPPQYVLETSAGRFQAFYLFSKPEPLAAVKAVAGRLKAVAKCDHGTSDISHVWRIAGTLNWPNAKKVGEGRSAEPQQVKVVKRFDGSTISLEKLSEALPEGAAAAGGNAKARAKSRKRRGQPHRAAIVGSVEWRSAVAATAKLPEDLQEEIRRPAEGDRSKALFNGIARLIELGHDDEQIENIIHLHPEGIGAKYADRDDLDREIARIRAKTRTRPTVQIRGGALPTVIDEAEIILVEADDALFQRGSLIVRPAQTRVPVAGDREIVGTRLVPVKPHHMMDRLSRAVDFQKLDKRSQTWLSTDCPRNVAEAYLQREGQWQLPMLTRVISAPTLRHDGSILDTPGYDEATGLLFDPQGVHFVSVADAPTKEDAIAALGELKRLIGTFPFVDDASRSVALSGILTALIRPSLSSAPLHGYNAPTAGSGKSLLVDVVSVIATGRETAVLAQGSTPEEFEKRLGAAFLAGDETISIDNCEQPLGGEFLCQVLTQPYVKIRLLGESKNVEVPTNTTLFATENNLRIVGDATRRAILCSLDPGVERPEHRKFDTHPLALVRTDRGKYVAAALTILRAFHVAGRPPQSLPLGSFETWSWARDAVIWLGEADPCDTMERLRAEDPRLLTLRGILHRWDRAIGPKRVSAADLAEVGAPGPGGRAYEEPKSAEEDLRDALLAVAGQRSVIDTRRLGNWLGHNKYRIADDMKIVAAGLVEGIGHWQLVHVDRRAVDLVDLGVSVSAMTSKMSEHTDNRL